MFGLLYCCPNVFIAFNLTHVLKLSLSSSTLVTHKLQIVLKYFPGEVRYKFLALGKNSYILMFLYSYMLKVIIIALLEIMKGVNKNKF